MIRLTFSALILLALAVSSGWAAESPDAVFARAAQMADPVQSREFYRVAALRYLAAAEADSEPGPLLYNAGNAFFLAGDLGRSVAAYRRAEPEMAGSALLRSNLAYVRKLAGNPEEPAGGWLWTWPASELWLMLFGGALVFWTALFLRQWTSLAWPRPLLIAAFTLTAAIAGTLLWQHFSNYGRCRGVLVGVDTVARKGPGYGYSPAFTAALTQGLECEVMRCEGNWAYLRLAEQRVAWVPVATLEVWQGHIPKN